MVALGALVVSKLPLRPEWQHPGAVAGELKLHDPWKNDKVYICSLRTDRRSSDSKFAILFVLATPLSNPTRKWLHWERNLAFRRIHTRRFSYPNPPRVVDNPKRILRRSSTPTNKGISHLQRASSLPSESVKCFTSFDLDKESIYPFKI